MNPFWVNFYYVKPDLLIKLFEIELSGHITMLGAIALTVYKETSQQFINLPPELSIRKESDLPSYVFDLADELFISQPEISSSNQ